MVAIGSIEHSLGKSGFEIELIEAQDFHSGVKTKRDSVPKHEKITFLFLLLIFGLQGCIIRSILPSGMGARGVSSEHVENMEMFSCSPT